MLRRCDGAKYRIAVSSKCPTGEWLDVIMPHLVRSSGMVFVNAGANKGYNVAEFLQRYASSNAPSSVAWHDALVRFEPNLDSPCGVCGACNSNSTTAVKRRNYDVPVRAYALEMIPSTAALLARMFAFFKIAGSAEHATVGSHSGKARVPAFAAGRENAIAKMHHAERTLRNASASSTATPMAITQMVTLDKFAAGNRIDRIDLLSIDTEGHDALVLEGARHLLQHKRVEVLEFEYHSVGMWDGTTLHHRNLKNVSAALHNFGYSCFWQRGRDSESAKTDRSSAVDASLVSMNGVSWCDMYEFRSWSNIVCAHSPTVLAAMRSLSI